MWTSRALLSIGLAFGPWGCLLAVSTSGLAGDPIDAAPAPETSIVDVAIDATDANAADVRDAFVPPDGSVLYTANGHSYLVVVEDGGIDWLSARDLATTMGGHLATIGDPAENAFVLDLVKAHPEAIRTNAVGPWLGGYQQAGAEEPLGGWTWVDGTPWSYTYWGDNQPDNSAGTENYLNWYALAWNDDSVNGTEAPIISLIVEFE